MTGESSACAVLRIDVFRLRGDVNALGGILPDILGATCSAAMSTNASPGPPDPGAADGTCLAPPASHPAWYPGAAYAGGCIVRPESPSLAGGPVVGPVRPAETIAPDC
jgi:hypothetical protein